MPWDSTPTRIIPARAGFTPIPSHAPRCLPDHPRSRGVYEQFWFLWSHTDGSSPLARGLRPIGLRPMSSRRIIPARAGFTSGSKRIPPWWTDHPRSRGVYLKRSVQFNQNEGSSPLARGLLDDLHDHLAKERIIPARAGFTRRGSASVLGHPDHPRSRGVYAEDVGAPEIIGGSSPLARGLLTHGDPVAD